MGKAPIKICVDVSSSVAHSFIVVRKILITLGVLVLAVVAIWATRIFGGRQLSLFLDRLGTLQRASSRVNSLVYEGSGTGGTRHINDIALSLNDRNERPLNVGTTISGQ